MSKRRGTPISQIVNPKSPLPLVGKGSGNEKKIRIFDYKEY